MKLTPSKIVELKYFYSIPIYQRLFEWDADNILTLLDDLKKSFLQTDPHGQEDYYIGMLTSTTDNELVDGQQRFTVMMLMGCIFQKYDEEWKKFLIDENTRLYFSSRPLDDAYLRSLIDKNPSDSQYVINKKMQNGVQLIKSYLENQNNIAVAERAAFASYVFNHLCFFVTNLPEGYSPRDLNKYFERMNTSGRNLEQHEILKVKLLSNLKCNVDKYMTLWNKLADVDTLLIRKRDEENEQSLAQRKHQAFQLGLDDILDSGIINGLRTNDNGDELTIISVEPSKIQPKTEREVNKDSHCALTFPYLLLQALFRFCNGKIESRIDDFFKPSNMLETFEKYLPYDSSHANEEDIKSFMTILLKSRLALDICFIRPSEFGYILDMNLSEDNADLKNLMMLQSMLYVSSSNYTNYRWFGWLMDAIENFGNNIPSANDLYSYIKARDEELNTLPEYAELSFGNDARYWFWKLDFYIWQHRNEIFKDSPEALTVADNYVFRRNRSIEHIAPQTPKSDSMMKWEDSPEDTIIRNSFGNLVMISQSLNSALSNESYEVKTAHVQSYCNGSKSGSIESLNLLIVHQEYKKWDRETIADHGQKMYELLKKSFNNK
jgi:hypothetical protein